MATNEDTRQYCTSYYVTQYRMRCYDERMRRFFQYALLIALLLQLFNHLIDSILHLFRHRPSIGVPRRLLVVLQHVPSHQLALVHGQPMLLLFGIEGRPNFAPVVGKFQREAAVLVNAEGLVETRFRDECRGRWRGLQMLQNNLG